MQQSIWFSQTITLHDINNQTSDGLSELLHIEYIDIQDRTLTATMPVTPRIHQPMGIMHGGASCVLAESVGSYAANLCIDITKQYCVGLQINTNHIKSIKKGMLIATAGAHHIGRSTHVWDIHIAHDKQLISVTRLTMAVLNH